MKVNGHALRAIRERSGMSVSELARRAGTSQPHLSNIERGRRSGSPALVCQLAEILKVPVLALLGDPDDADLEHLRTRSPEVAPTGDDAGAPRP